ncbi:MAG: MerR family transcriptional regulator [Candidatus Omnitrophica bacterium]|nr:MerR family transcriptional regulator [Candidatus Omnitrophota bacterium]
MEDTVSIKELAKQLKISPATVNYYTNLGFFKIKDRRGNMRLYDKAEISSIFEKVRQLRREGYSLKIIQQKLEKGYSI